LQEKRYYTDLKTNINELSNKVDLFNTIINTLPGNYWWKDREGKYLGCNTNVAKLLNLPNVSYVIGKTDYELPWKDLADTMIKHDKEVMRSGEPMVGVEVIRTNDGRLIHFLVTKAPLFDDQGNVQGTVATSFDITEQKKLEEKLIEKNKELTEEKAKSEIANQAKSAFIANISHDVKVPLAGLIGISSMMKESDSYCCPENAALVHDAGQALLTMMDKILDFVKSEFPGFKKLQQNETFSIKKMANEIFLLFRPAAKNKNIELSLVLNETLPDYIISKPHEVYKIINNLLSNAIKFTKEGYIAIDISHTTKDDGTYLNMLVKDTGIGIPADKREIVFEWFERLTPAYQGIYDGTGMGLAVVKQSVEVLKGTTTINDNQPCGTIFSIEIPIEIAENVTEESNMINPDYQLAINKTIKEVRDNTNINESAQTAQQTKSNHKRLLLIEDDRIAGAAEKMLLKSIGYDVTLVSTGEDGVEEALSTPYDIIMTDIGLPKMSGIEVLKVLRGSGIDYPIYALTGHANEQQLAMESFQFTKVMTKPLNLDDLVKAIAQDENKASSIINLVESEKITGSQSLAKELLQIFLASLPKDIITIKDALEKKDIKMLSEAIHRLRGAVRYVSVPELSEILEQIHLEMKSVENDNIQQLSTQFEKLFLAASQLLEEAKKQQIV